MKGKMTMPEKAISIAKSHGGLVRTSDAAHEGVGANALYRLQNAGTLEKLSRGIFRLKRGKPLANPDLVIVAARAPRSVVCLISALSFHDITTQIPHAVSIAIPKSGEPPRIEYPPVDVHHFSGVSFDYGIEEHRIDRVKVRIYSSEKTIADCFKLRNQVGEDVAIEALKLYRARKKFNAQELMICAKICRVEGVMLPYVKALS